tara:strand:- start:178 stop:357 length:180 start_codon:yes stop_codon:yes gene_type:complete
MIDITSAKYIKEVLISDDNTAVQVVSNGKTYYVPLDPNNTDYQDVQEWVSSGNTIEEAD